jgi:predicted aspartyl protease
MHGHFTEEDRLVIPIEIFGASEEFKKTIPAIIDTGFSGYLTLPFTEAFPLGLVLQGEQSYLLADGSSSRHFVCLGTVIVNGQRMIVPIDVQQGGPILIGMDLLKKLGQRLTIDFKLNEFELSNQSSKPHRVGLKNVKIRI